MGAGFNPATFGYEAELCKLVPPSTIAVPQLSASSATVIAARRSSDASETPYRAATAHSVSQSACATGSGVVSMCLRENVEQEAEVVRVWDPGSGCALP